MHIYVRYNSTHSKELIKLNVNYMLIFIFVYYYKKIEHNKYLNIFAFYVFGPRWRFHPWMSCLSYPRRHYRNLEVVFNETRCTCGGLSLDLEFKGTVYEILNFYCRVGWVNRPAIYRPRVKWHSMKDVLPI